MNNMFVTCLLLKNAYQVNGILYAIKQIPLIKKIIPENVYSISAFKIFGNIISVIWTIITALVGKLIYFLAIWGSVKLFVLSGVFNIPYESDLFIHILFFMSIIGGIWNTFLFDNSKDMYYAVILMRMNAKKYALFNYVCSLIKLIIGFLIFGVIFGLLVGVPIWMCLLIPIFVTGLKLTLAAFNMYRYEKKGIMHSENKLKRSRTIAVAVLILAAYVLPMIGVVLPQWLAVLFMVIFIFTGCFSVREIYTFKFYRECYQEVLKPVAYQKELVRDIVRKRNNKLIVEDDSITSNRNGFEYLNELFIKRHRGLLWKASKIITLVSACLILVVLLLFAIFPRIKSGVNNVMISRISWIVIAMYAINRGTGFTQMIFMNCDHSLLTYSFYKQPKFVLKLFSIRLREIMKINLLPAIVLGVGFALLLYASGGTADVRNYLVLIISIPMLSMFFSVHYLTVYYLLQPYNAGTEMKSAPYAIITWATYYICYSITNIKVPTVIFGAMTIIFCFAYCLVACILVYNIAPKTFKLHN